MIQRIIDQFARFFVGGLFIFSGLIKLNDPIGTEIKMEEYFDVFATDFGSFFKVFIPYALEIGLVLIVLEIALGVALLINHKMKLTTRLLLALIVFFTFLTFYSAYFDKVTDCGCFGDAIKLTPWESFTKDIILLVFVLHLAWHHRRYEPTLRTREGHAVVGVATALSLFLGIYAILHLPFIDFRAYKIGNHIPQQMQPAEAPIIEYVFEKDGKEVTSQKFLTEQEGYKYKSSRVLNEEKTVPKISDYAVTGVDGENYTEYTFDGAKLLIVIYDVNKASVSNIDALRDLVKALEGSPVEVMALTSSAEADFEAFRHEHQLPVSYYFADATVLKTIIRSNPGITLWVNGTVKDMWHHNDTPTAQEVLSQLD
jgi:uncharacterized membrane protein YphA (DoxX/SURF4 family)